MTARGKGRESVHACATRTHAGSVRSFTGTDRLASRSAWNRCSCSNMLRIHCARARACVRADITSTEIKGGINTWNFRLPNLVKATGVETLLRLPSSARFDEFPVQGKSFPLRNTTNCSLQVELSTDCSAGEEGGGPASGKWMEATATEFWRNNDNNEKKKKRV